jgi:hypothetical protein
LTIALKRLALAAVLSGVVLLTVGGPAQAAAPCWKELMNDWYQPPIEKTYPIPCYREAVDHLPTDARLYSSAREDILRAMGQAIALQKQQEQQQQQAPTTTAAPATTEPPPPPPPPPPAETTPATTAEEPTTTEEAVAPPPTTTSPGRPKPKGVAGALDKLNPGEADSFPLPLIILGAIAILLVAAGVIGMIWRRRSGGADTTGTV